MDDIKTDNGISRRIFVLGGVAAGISAVGLGGLPACSPQQSGGSKDENIIDDTENSSLGPNQYQAKSSKRQK